MWSTAKEFWWQHKGKLHLQMPLRGLRFPLYHFQLLQVWVHFSPKPIYLLLHLSDCRSVRTHGNASERGNATALGSCPSALLLAYKSSLSVRKWYANNMLTLPAQMQAGARAGASPSAKGEHRGLFRLVLSLQYWLFLLSDAASNCDSGETASSTPTVLALLFFVSKLIHQGREKGKSHRRGKEVGHLCTSGFFSLLHQVPDMCPHIQGPS